MIWRDKSARIPFVVLGIFLLAGSSITSMIIIGLENQHAKNVSISMNTGEIEKMVSSLKIDLSTCLNYAGMYAMNYAGKHPVTKVNEDSNVAKDYNGGSWDNTRDGWDINEMIQFNLNWIRNMTRNKMNLYIEENYIHDSFNNGRYAINVDYIKKWRDIKVKEIYMKLDREHTKPISSAPNSIRNLFADGREEYPVYWIFYVLLKIEIKDLKTNQIIEKKIINVSSLISSRLPLLMQLTENFEKYINTTNILDNKLFLIFTLLSEVYTEGRALFQYSGQYEKVPNIVDNRWLRYLLNGAILFEEFMFFNSIDPVTAVALLLNWKDLTAIGFPEEKEIKEEFNSIDTNQFAKIFGEPDENLLRTISNDENEQTNAKEKINEAAVEINLTDIAHALLYDIQYNYYYYTDNGELYKENGELPHSFKGYEIEKEGKTYVLMHPPPYHYYNKTYYEKYHKNLSEYTYHGKKWMHDGYLFHIIPDSKKFWDESASNNLNEKVVEQIENEIKKAYHVKFDIEIGCNVNEYASPHAADYCDPWELESKKAVTSALNEGDAINSFPYREKWVTEWKQTCYYTVGNETHSFTRKKDITITFVVYATYPNVKDAFNSANIMLSQIRHDDNLFYLSKDFVKDFIRIREQILNSQHCTNQQYSIEKTGEGMNWLRGINGEIVNALEEICNEVRNIETNVKDIKNKNGNQIIDESIGQLLQKIEENKTRYIKKDFYKDGSKFKSCGALVIEKMREWYVNEIKSILRNASKKAKEDMNKNIGKELEKHKIKMDEMNRAKEKLNGMDANNLPALQFGLTMPLINYSLNWNEEIGFSIDQTPDYFKPSKNTDSYKFLEKNTCIFGPTGLPILPTPVTPWVITINAWYIEIQGSFSKFEVIDTVGEMYPDMLFGETGQAYVREKERVYDPCSKFSEHIGDTEPIQFTITTANIAVVPPSFVGDINPTSYPVEKEGIGLRGG